MKLYLGIRFIGGGTEGKGGQLTVHMESVCVGEGQNRTPSVNEWCALTRLQSSEKEMLDAVVWELHLLCNFNIAVTSSL